MYSLVAIDVDDTLINSELRISDRNKEAILQAKKAGALLTLATGRMFRSALPFAEQLEMDLPLITYHGALVKQSFSGETLYHQPIPRHLALQLIRLCQDKDLHLNLYIDDELLVAEENEHTEYYLHVARVPCCVVGDLERYMHRYPEKSPTKLTIVAGEKVIPRLQYELEQFFGGDLLIAQSKSRFLEITDPEANKGQALVFLAQKFGIPLEKTMAIGDSMNDIPMLQKAGLGIAVGNARPQVKQAAHIVVSANNEDGVAEAIEDYVLPGFRRELNGT